MEDRGVSGSRLTYFPTIHNPNRYSVAAFFGNRNRPRKIGFGSSVPQFLGSIGFAVVTNLVVVSVEKVTGEAEKEENSSP